MSQKGEILDVDFFNLENGKFSEFIKIGNSASWNYQKGCRLQWINENGLIFNSTIDGLLGSEIIEIETLKEQIINFLIDTVFNDGNWATSFSYGRLQELKPVYKYDYADGGL